ncbi:MAG: hypothetical protein PHW18_08700 [Sulfuricurvum sp.]|uniref:hypothetical protein n=1 Tax=Sulfuricurvum sp. TaxID=2025608 RepID=UPI002621CC2A|nr:hypothetical protein [Sulfuricurvum sp.]MDD2829636.1 hypothetical protein [Sulfuricurvum sp.]MDD4950567.1 hypothetical protein [Sulfuricurvum sp.]
MSIKKVILYTFIIAVPSVFLIKWGIENTAYDSNKIPDINPHPKEKVRIYGKFPLNPNKYYIKASVRYIATNPKCDNVIWLAGARFAQDENVDLNATMSDNHYELNIYHDYYKQGACDWQIGEIDIVTIQKDTNKSSYVVEFSTKKSGTSAFQIGNNLIKAKSPLNFVCNYEYHASSDYTRYFCEDSVQDISAPETDGAGAFVAIFLPDSQKEFEVNFQQIAEPMKIIKQGEK